MKYKHYFYRGVIGVFLLLLTHLLSAQEMKVDFQRSWGWGVLEDVLLLNKVNILMYVEVGGEKIPTHIHLDIAFKVCQNREQLLLVPILTGDEPVCQQEHPDFRDPRVLKATVAGREAPQEIRVNEFDLSDSRAYGIFLPEAEETPHWRHQVQLTNVRLNRVVEDAADPQWDKVITTYHDILLQYNPQTLHLEQVNKALLKAPATQILIELNWGDNPNELDAHLTGPAPDLKSAAYNHEPDRFHLYFDDQKLDEYNAELFVGDGRFEVKPERIVLSTPEHKEQLRAGIYRFSVHHHNGKGTLAQSNATVKLNIGDEAAVWFRPPVDVDNFLTGDRTDLWIPFELDVTRDGMVNVRRLNRYEQLSNGNPHEIR